MKRPFYLTTLLVMSLLLIPFATLEAQLEREELKLSVDEAVRMALAKNLTIIVERFNPPILTTEIGVEQAAFDPVLLSEGRFNTQRLPTATALAGAAVAAQENRTLNFGLRQRFLTGGRYEITFNNNRQETNSRFVSPRANYASDLTLTLTQPLLRNFGLDFNRSRIRIARLNRDISEERLREVVTRTVAQVQTSYWDLVLARESVEVAKRSLELARDLLRRNKIMIEAGVLAPVEIFQAEAEVASREAELIAAESAVRNAEDSLKQLLNLEGDIAIIPTDRPTITVREVSFEETLREALERRPEIRQAKTQTVSKEISLKAVRNQLRPSLDLTAFFGLNGLGGELERDVDVLVSGDRYHAGVGVVLEIPIGNRAARQRFRRSQLELEQSVATLRELESRVTLEVRLAVRNLLTGLKRIEATKAARVAAEKALEAEEKKFRVGLTTSFNILRFQRDLTAAQNLEMQALIEYSKSLVELERVKGTLLQSNNITF